MARLTAAGVLDYLRHLARAEECDGQSDGQLLRQFAARRDEGAFATLLRRHGPLVLGVCRQVLGDAPDAEDAFQATFLVLARKASSIRRQSLAAWLHRVAVNVSRTARAGAARRRAHERRAALAAPADHVDEAALRDWQPILHEEVDRLPAKYRLPVVCCYLEGKTHDEAARQLGWPVGTVKGRLARARDLLRTRLARRGLALTAAATAAALARGTATAAVPPALLGRAVRDAVPFAAGGAVPTRAAAWAKGALQAMTAKKLIRVGALLLAVGVVGAGVGLLAGRGEERKGDQPVQQADPAPARDDFGPEVNGLRAKVTLDRDRYEVGQAIVATYVVRNVSKEEQTVWHSGFWANHEVIVHDDAGKEPAPTEYGKECRRSFSPGGVRKKNTPVPIAPGDEDAAYEKYDLTKLYDLSRPGRYTVRYVYEEKLGGWEGRLPSNEAAFEVVAKGEKARPADGAAAGASRGPELRSGQKFEGEIDEKSNRGNPGGEGHLYGYRALVPVTLRAGQDVTASAGVVGARRTVGLMLKDPTGKILGSSKMEPGAARIKVEQVNANGKYTIELYSDLIGPYTLWVADTADELDRKELQEKISRLEKELAALRERLKAQERNKSP